MKFFSAVLLASAGLAAAAPVSDATPSSLSLLKRLDYCGSTEAQQCDLTRCDDKKYAKIGQRATMKALQWLRDDDKNELYPLPPDVFTVDPGKTAMVACMGHVGFFIRVSEEVDHPIAFESKDVAWYMDDTYHRCNGGAPADDDIPTHSYGYLHESHDWSIIASGNAPCSGYDTENFPKDA
jgi:hypothetical protein